MKIHAGFEIVYDCAQPTPMLLNLNVHPSRHADLLTAQTLCFDRYLQAASWRDAFGNDGMRIVAPAGRTRIATDFTILDTGRPDMPPPDGPPAAIADLPDEALGFLLGSRYCDTDLLADFAWGHFGHIAAGRERVQAICDFVHGHIAFDYMKASPKRTAHDAWRERTGVCRDFAHLAIALCRCVNIPARYATGYLGDIGVPASPDPGDFSAWFEAWLGDRWYTFDARHNAPRIGRILMATGRDATDVALSTSFGAAQLVGFAVTTEAISEASVAATRRRAVSANAPRRSVFADIAAGDIATNRQLNGVRPPPLPVARRAAAAHVRQG
jgi:transglutaminase-like putative cysteine protease